MTQIPPHPAPYSKALLPIFASIIDRYSRGDGTLVLDPMAGIGRIHDLNGMTRHRLDTKGVELMPGWAAAHPQTIVGDATSLPSVWSGFYDFVIVSPAYANRMRDHHKNADRCKACRGTKFDVLPPNESMIQSERRGLHNLRVVHRDGTMEPNLGGRALTTDIIVDAAKVCTKCHGTGLSHRRSYAHYYGRDEFFLDADPEQNSGLMAFDDKYKALHEAAWREAYRVLHPGGIFILNVKDFYETDRKTKEKVLVRVAAWHRDAAKRCGFVRLQTINVAATGYRNGSNRESRTEHEYVYVFRKPEVST